MVEYTVVNATKSGEFTGKGGVMHKYLVQLEGVDVGVEVVQKPDTPVLKAGDKLNGTIEDTQYGKKFKKEFSGGRGGGGYKESPEKAEDIRRMNALTNATQIVSHSSMGDKIDPKEVLRTAELLNLWLAKKIKISLSDNSSIENAKEVFAGAEVVDSEPQVSPAVEEARATAERIKADSEAKKVTEAEKEPVPFEEEEINLDDIPFG